MEDKEKLGHLLLHWIEHNEEHANEFLEWANKAKEFGESPVHDDIVEATNQLEKANEFLRSASEKLKN